MTPQATETMAHYNRWMNERLYAICSGLTDEQRKRDVGAFFRSVHGTLNHLLLGDRIWLGRFTDAPFAVTSLAQELCADFEELRSERMKTDLAIIEWARSLTPAMLAADLIYTSVANPQRRRYPLWFAATHFFNHQTHHRGQVTTLLSQFGCDPGVTDLIAMPKPEWESRSPQ